MRITAGPDVRCPIGYMRSMVCNAMPDVWLWRWGRSSCPPRRMPCRASCVDVHLSRPLIILDHVHVHAPCPCVHVCALICRPTQRSALCRQRTHRAHGILPTQHVEEGLLSGHVHICVPVRAHALNLSWLCGPTSVAGAPGVHLQLWLLAVCLLASGLEVAAAAAAACSATLFSVPDLWT